MKKTPAKNNPDCPDAMGHMSTVIGETMKIAGALNLASMPRVLEETEAYAAQQTLPECLSIDFSEVTSIDSSAVALLLHWRRMSLRLGKMLRYVNLPPNLKSLAELYGVDELIKCPSQRSAA